MSEPSSPIHPRSYLAALQQSGNVISALTAYDYPTARLLDEAGIDLLLVGDSLGMVVLGYQDTVDVTLTDMVRHTGAVARGAKRALIVSDLPAGSYDDADAAVVSGRELMGAGAHCVKLEGGAEVAPQIEALIAAGIPVVGHLGMLPQHVREEGGYKKKGLTEDEAQRIIKDATLLEKLGVCAIVLESVKGGTAGRVRNAISIPTIGIGSGGDCDGQIRVTHDLIGMFPWFRPAFAEQYADIATDISKSATNYIDDLAKMRP